MTKETNKNILSKFEAVGTTEIKEEQDSIIGTMKAVFESNKSKYFTQKMFCQVLSKSNPFVNKTLHKLMEQGVITRVKNGNKFYYRAVASKTAQ